MSRPTLYHSGIFKTILEDMIANLKNIDGATEESIITQINSCQERAIRLLRDNALSNPLTFPINLDTLDNWNVLVDTIKSKATENSLESRIPEFIPFGGYYTDIIANKRYISPLYISGRDLQERMGNIVISYTDTDKEIAIERLNNIVLTIMLSLPPKYVNLNIIDLGMEGSAGFLTSNLDSGIYHDEVVVDQESFAKFLTRIKKTLAERIKTQSNDKTSTPTKPLELVLLLGDPDISDYHWNDLKPIWENGRKYGVHFMLLKNRLCMPPREDIRPALEGLNYSEISSSIPQYSINVYDAARLTPIAKVKGLAELCFEYLNKGFQAKEKSVKIIEDSVLEDIYDDCRNGELNVEIGKGERSNASFTLDLVSHIHAFILGMSGSGKSVLLHNIIANLIGKYSPEQLELFLMDFKLGGVEFNRYKDTKHVKALLVDNSDNSVVLEILRELNTTMYERGKLLKSANVQRIDEYNRVNQDKPMPQIIAVIDECHNIFNLEGGRQTGIQREVINILTKITKEGRNQGVHLLMATQTLAGADIPGEILNNLSDHYLLKCAQSDSERLAPGSSSTTFGLPTGKILHHHQSGSELFQGYYLGDSALDAKVSLANEKASKRKSNGQYYFSGSQIFKLTEDVFESIFAYNNLILTPGETCSLRHKPVSISLPKQDSQNVLITGIDLANTNRTVIALLNSAIRHNQKSGGRYNIVVINCLGENEILQDWHNNGVIKILNDKCERSDFLGRIANDIECENASPTLLFLLGQQMFRELKKDFPISVKVDTKPQRVRVNNEIEDTDLLLDIPDLPDTNEDIDFGFDEADNDFAISSDLLTQQDSESKDASQNGNTIVETSFSKALKAILKAGPEQNVHTIMQIDKPSNILFEEYIGKKMIYDMFAHLLILRGDESTANTLGLRDNVRPEKLSADEDRLKAIYFNEETDMYTTFTPYIVETN